MKEDYNWSRLLDDTINNDYYNKNKYYDSIDEILKYYEDSIKKTTVETWRKTEVETDEEKLEKMDISVIEKFLRKKKLEQLEKSK